MASASRCASRWGRKPLNRTRGHQGATKLLECSDHVAERTSTGVCSGFFPMFLWIGRAREAIELLAELEFSYLEIMIHEEDGHFKPQELLTDLRASWPAAAIPPGSLR